MVEASGTGVSVTEIGEQLAWLGAALHPVGNELGIAYCSPFVSEIYSNKPPNLGTGLPSLPDTICKIDFHFERKEDTAVPSNGQCWHHLFKNPVVVRGYPIPRRSEPSTGLEIPLNMMAGLARTQRINIFNRKLFIKGFSTLLTPTNRIGDMLIWHLLYNQSGNRISYIDSTTPHLENVNILLLT
jgi:hypothetical protein